MFGDKGRILFGPVQPDSPNAIPGPFQKKLGGR